MKTKISLLLLAILCNFAVFAQSDFNTYFEKKSLRVDFALSGNLTSLPDMYRQMGQMQREIERLKLAIDNAQLTMNKS